MGSLANQYISQSFKSLIHLGSDTTISSSYTDLQDGLGNSLKISVNAQGDISASGNIFAANLATITYDTGSLLTTASANLNVLTFTKGNGSTFNVTVNTGSTDISSLNAFTASVAGTNAFTASIRNTNAFTASIAGTNTFTASIAGTNAFTQSANQRLNSLESFTASLDTTYVTQAELASATGALEDSIDTKLNSASFNDYTQSTDAKINSLNAFTQSADQRLDSIEAQSGSWVTSAITASSLVTASFDNGTRNLTFTKGNNTTFAVLIPAASGSTINTGSFATTGSNNFVGNQSITGSLIVSGSATNDVEIYGNIRVYTDTVNAFDGPTTFGNIYVGSGNIGINTNFGLDWTAGPKLNTAGEQMHITASVFGITGSLNVKGSTILSGSAFINNLQNGITDVVVTYDTTTGELRKATAAAILSASLDTAEFWSTITQSGSAGVSGSITFNNSGSVAGISVVNNTQVTLAQAGTYNIQFSAQIESTAGADTVYLWFKKNGVNISDSASKAVLANNTAQVITVNLFDSGVANDYYELAYQTTNGNARVLYEPAAGNIPAIPSVILTIQQIR